MSAGGGDRLDRTYFLPFNQPERIAIQKNLNSKHCQGDRPQTSQLRLLF
ncbi:MULTISPECIES: hypothetical protein [unclassified Microcoleus]